MIFEIIAAYLGYRRWGGWRGAVKGVLILWAVYLVVVGLILVPLVFLGGQVESILSEVGTSI